jgi:hypothetical protein
MGQLRARISTSVAAVAIVVLGLTVSLPVEAAAPAPFLVGAAASSADPEGSYEGICIGGYGAFCTRPMTEVRDPLFARAIAITGEGGEGDTLIVVTTTATGLFSQYKSHWGEVGATDIRRIVAERTGVPAGNIIVQSDHSHAAPDTIGIWGGVTVAYMERLRDAAVDAAVTAFEEREPAVVSVGTADGPPLKTSYDRPPTNMADDELRVLFAEDRSGRAVATLLNYSPHATVLGSSNRGGASGDWTAWAAEELEFAHGGVGVAAIGAIGATDWNKVGATEEEREAEARHRIRRLVSEAYAGRQAVGGDEVAVRTTLLREPLAAPVLTANLLPGIPSPGVGVADGAVSMERATTPPALTGLAVGTYASAARVGDVLLSAFPGEAFPQLQAALVDGVEARAHFVIGAANDFLGYMAAGEDTYLQALENGTLFLAGCPDSDLRKALGRQGGCNDHWTLMVSPTIGRHTLCTVQAAAEEIGFDVAGQEAACPILTALDTPEED